MADSTPPTAPEGAQPPRPRLLRHNGGGGELPRPGPKPALTIGAIAQSAVDLADADGLAAVSMSKVAAALGYTTMSLYRYVESKDELLVVMTDHAYGPPDPERATGDWRGWLENWARDFRAALLRHPWLIDLVPTEPPLGPNQIRWMEQGLTAMRGIDLPEQQKLSSLLLVNVFVLGQTRLAHAIAPPRDQPAEPGQEAPIELYGLHLVQLIDPDHFPSMWAAVSSGSLDDDDTDFGDDEFEFGLTVVLDGIAARVRRSSRGDETHEAQG